MRLNEFRIELKKILYKQDGECSQFLEYAIIDNQWIIEA